MPALTRTVAVLPPSASREAGLVARAAFHLVFWTAIAIGLSRDAQTRAQQEGPARVEQFGPVVAFGDLSTRDQRIALALREGLVEAERVRAASGNWPEPAALAAQGVPPFAKNPLDRTMAPWTLARAGPLVNYADAPPAGEHAFLAVIAEPPPAAAGSAPDPSPADDVHHKLPDGTMLHVTVWLGPAALDAGAGPVAVPPLLRGWRQVVAGDPARSP